MRTSDPHPAVRNGAARGLELPLQQFSVFESTDFMAVQQALCQAIVPHRLRRIGTGAVIDGRINRVSLPGIRFQAMSVGAPVEVLPTTLEDCFIIHMPLSGVTRFSVAGESFAATEHTAAVLSPGVPMRAVWEEQCSAMLVCIERDALNRHATELLGRPLRVPLQFAPRLALDTAGGAAWRRLFTYAIAELEARGSGPVQSVRDTDAVRLALSTVLTALTNNYSAHLAEPAGDDCPGIVRAADAFMREHLTSPIRIADVAAAVGVAPRTLRKAFARHRGCAPMRVFRSMRLDGVHRELQALGLGANITELAMRWGFQELGRFANDYRARFGERPSDTRRRSTASRVN